MTVTIRHIRLRAITSDGSYGADLALDAGLNVLRAENSAGKSTLISSLVFALGLEGMLGPQHAIPLPHAMTESLQGQDGSSHAVISSYVMLELERDDGQALTVRRSVRDSDTDHHLVSTWRAPILTAGATGEPVDYYVRQPGSAQEERGFHRFLSQWLGWELPEVPRYDGSSAPLYPEAIAPLFIVEQKRGWSGLQSQTPTYMQLRQVKERAREFVLALEALENRARLQALETRLSELRVDWKTQVANITGALTAGGFASTGLPTAPSLEWPPTPEPALMALREDEWSSISQERRVLADELDAATQVVSSGRRADAVQQDELRNAEDELRELSAKTAYLRSELSLEQQSLDDAVATEERLLLDRRRHNDLLRLRSLGSDSEETLHADECPVCHQALGDLLIDPSVEVGAMSVEETIDYIDAQLELVRAVKRASARSISDYTASLAAVGQLAGASRSRIRSLKEDLTAPGDQPSVEAVQSVLELRRRVELVDGIEQQWVGALERLGVLVDEHFAIAAELKQLKGGELSERDLQKLEALEQTLQGHLVGFGFDSFDVKDIYLDRDTYLPTHDGYDLTFESSASDVIRTIWAFLLALLEVSLEYEGNHPGFLVFDEPRQQMTAQLSFRELLSRSAGVRNGQILFATSEPQDQLESMLVGLDANLVQFEGKVLSKIREDVS